MNRFGQVIFALIPALVTPLFFYILAEGIFNFGGGEKDILLSFVWAVWAIAFGISAIILIYRGWRLSRWFFRSIFVATSVLLMLWLLALLVSVLGPH